jgi:hypothetical protein
MVIFCVRVACVLYWLLLSDDIAKQEHKLPPGHCSTSLILYPPLLRIIKPGHEHVLIGFTQSSALLLFL